MANQDHAQWLNEGVKSWNRRRKKVKFLPDLSGVRFFDFLPPDFRESPKTSRYFERIDLSGANLSRADLSDLNFASAKFKEANLADSDLRLSNFTGADFSSSNLRGAKFSNSSLGDAKFLGALLTPDVREEVRRLGAVFIDDRIDDETFVVTSDLEEMEIDWLSGSSNGSLVYRRLTPLTVSQERKELGKSRSTTQASRKNSYDVFFATNRDAIYERGKLVSFGKKNAKVLHYGVCEVIVPDSHRVGSLGSPMWRRLLNGKDDRLRIDELIALSDELFWRFISDTSRKMKVKECPTLFVHGFNTSFEHAILRSAQVGFDLGIGQGIGLFSWPSKGSILSYNADEASVEASKYFLADFIGDFVKNFPTERINLIAHSMGCRCLVGAMEILGNAKVTVLDNINQIILAAADIDTALMPLQGKFSLTHAERVTSYVSQHDNALKISGWLHEYPRVGAYPPIFVLKGMDTILVNDSDLGNFSHGYLSTSRTVLNDVFSILKNNHPPSMRHCLDLVEDDRGSFWRMRL